MSGLSPLLLVATLIAAVGAASVSQARPALHHAATVAQLRATAGRASTIDVGMLVLAAR